MTLTLTYSNFLKIGKGKTNIFGTFLNIDSGLSTNFANREPRERQIHRSVHFFDVVVLKIRIHGYSTINNVEMESKRAPTQQQQFPRSQ